jgi:hypothetical protein
LKNKKAVILAAITHEAMVALSRSTMVDPAFMWKEWLTRHFDPHSSRFESRFP